MDDDRETLAKVGFGALIVAAVMASAALLVGVVRHGDEIVAGLVVLSLRTLLVLVAVGVAAYIVGTLYTSLVGQIASLEKRFEMELKALRRKSPAVVASLLLLGQAVVSATDRTLQGNTSVKISLSVGLLLYFWLANALLAGKTKGQPTAGVLLWFVGIALNVFAVAAFYQIGLPDLISALAGLNTVQQVYFTAMLVILLIVPLIHRKLVESS